MQKIKANFDPSVKSWFERQFSAATDCQVKSWDALGKGSPNTLIAAPTGSGKTLAAFLRAIDDLTKLAKRGALEEKTRILYVSPLKALSNDIRKNLEEPLKQMREGMTKESEENIEQIRVGVRTGDTKPSERAFMIKHPPHILVTTPESLYILLTSDSGRTLLEDVDTVIVDEIHSLMNSKRGAHFSLSLARLENLCRERPKRIGISATQRPIWGVAEFLTGKSRAEIEASGECEIIDEGHHRKRDIAIEMLPSPLQTVMPKEGASEMLDRISQLIKQHSTTLVFVNSRRAAERIARGLAEKLEEETVCAHHGSLSKERRLRAEEQLKNGQLKALVATASLELGIDIGDVDLVCQIGVTSSLSTLLQRVGRSGHSVDGLAKGRIFPQTKDDLVVCVAMLDMLERGELDSLQSPKPSLDVLAQQIVAEVSCADWDIASLFKMVKNSWPYRTLQEKQYRAVLKMLSDGFSFPQGRLSAFLHIDNINNKVKPRRSARLIAITCGGAIPDTADYDVIVENGGEIVGSVNEDFAIESLPGNIFQLGNTSWRVLRVETNAVKVEDAAGEPPNMPFWLGEAPSRSDELSYSVSRLRENISSLCELGNGNSKDLEKHVLRIPGVSSEAARQISDYLLSGWRALGVIPSQKNLVIERFFDESGGMQLVVHSPFGGRLNRAWGLALRKRFCRAFNFELQAAALEDSIVISLGTIHSFPLNDVWNYLNSNTVRDVLTQAVLDSPIFTIRWRWVASCALAIQRFRNGKKTPAYLIRMNAEDLSASVFPDQLACAENLVGSREIPDHPLIEQTIKDCLQDAMDLEKLTILISEIRDGAKNLTAKDMTEPSPFALQVLNANPYAFLDDAPLEERRTRAVQVNHFRDFKEGYDPAHLDLQVIERVKDEAWPKPRDKDELYEALLQIGFLRNEHVAELGSKEEVSILLEELRKEGRAAQVGKSLKGWAAVEKLEALQVIWSIGPYAENSAPKKNDDETLDSLLHERLEVTGPISVRELSTAFGIPRAPVEQSLVRLEQKGVVLRGEFNIRDKNIGWCSRRLLARMHYLSAKGARERVRPVPVPAFTQSLFLWQHVSKDTRLEGREALFTVIEQLSGVEAPAGAWESYIFPSRIVEYKKEDLDYLVRSGRVVWARLSPKTSDYNTRNTGTLINTPIAVLPRADLRQWLATKLSDSENRISPAALQVFNTICASGALFFNDLVGHTGLNPINVASALNELAALGQVTCDSFAGLRLLTERARVVGTHSRNRPALEDAGRWGLVRGDQPISEISAEERAETIVRILLKRYGIIFKSLLTREKNIPPWRVLGRCLRRLEMRGEVRGGRFVEGFGEQFADPQAAHLLEQVKKKKSMKTIDVINAADPLNLTGILKNGDRVPVSTRTQMAFLDGVLAGYRHRDEFRMVADLNMETEMAVKSALIEPGHGRKKRLRFSGSRRSYR